MTRAARHPPAPPVRRPGESDRATRCSSAEGHQRLQRPLQPRRRQLQTRLARLPHPGGHQRRGSHRPQPLLVAPRARPPRRAPSGARAAPTAHRPARASSPIAPGHHPLRNHPVHGEPEPLGHQRRPGAPPASAPDPRRAAAAPGAWTAPSPPPATGRGTPPPRRAPGASTWRSLEVDGPSTTRPGSPSCGSSVPPELVEALAQHLPQPLPPARQSQRALQQLRPAPAVTASGPAASCCTRKGTVRVSSASSGSSAESGEDRRQPRDAGRPAPQSEPLQPPPGREVVEEAEERVRRPPDRRRAPPSVSATRPPRPAELALQLRQPPRRRPPAAPAGDGAGRSATAPQASGCRWNPVVRPSSVKRSPPPASSGTAGTTKGGVEKRNPSCSYPDASCACSAHRTRKPPLREQRRRERPAQLGPQDQHVVDVARRVPGAMRGRGGSVGTVRSAP